MNLFKSIFFYLTNSRYRHAIQNVAYLMQNQNKFEQQYEEEMEKIKSETLKIYKERIDSLVYIKDYVTHQEAIKKINDLLNDLKMGYREIENN